MPWYRAYYRWLGGKRAPVYIILADSKRVARDYVGRTGHHYTASDWSVTEYTQDNGMPELRMRQRTGCVANYGDTVLLAFAHNGVEFEITDMHHSVVRDLIVLGPRLPEGVMSCRNTRRPASTLQPVKA